MEKIPGLIDGPIVFYDGDCGFCQYWVSFVLKRDRAQVFRFSPLQGDYAKAHLPEVYVKDLRTLVCWNRGRLTTKSDAVIAVLMGLGGFWRMACVFFIFPGFIRNGVYHGVARYRRFLMPQDCRLPSPEEMKRFL